MNHRNLRSVWTKYIQVWIHKILLVITKIKIINVEVDSDQLELTYWFPLKWRLKLKKRLKPLQTREGSEPEAALLHSCYRCNLKSADSRGRRQYFMSLTAYRTHMEPQYVIHNVWRDTTTTTGACACALVCGACVYVCEYECDYIWQ